MKRARTVLAAATLAWSMLTLSAPAIAMAKDGGHAPAEPAHHDGKKKDLKDLGPASGSQLVTGSIVMKVQNKDKLQAYIRSTVTPGSPDFHKYLSVEDFKAKFAPSDEVVHQIIRYLQSYGLTATPDKDNLLISVTGTVNQIDALFHADIHDFSENGKDFHAPSKRPEAPSQYLSDILTIVGLNNYTSLYRSMTAETAQVPGAVIHSVTPPQVHGNGIDPGTGVPQIFTVGDVARLYNINPIYQAGVTGKGESLGIATLAGFQPSDAYQYWSAIGLRTDPNRIREIPVDGGSGSVGPDSFETTLDVEQAGGIAPGAKMDVYEAPNTDYGFIDLFYRAVSDNRVNTLSTSWGMPEAFYFNSLLTGGDYTAQLVAMDQAFMEAAAQGISVFAAAGDNGAYDVNGPTYGFTYPQFTKLVSADAPASDPYVTAAAGTTLPGVTIQMKNGEVSTGNAQRPWAWDYFTNYITQYYGSMGIYDLGFFPAGTGGAVSSYWGTPWYQQGLSGIQTTSGPDSALTVTSNVYNPDGSVAYPADTTLLTLPPGFAGRNEADISLNADPFTGYLVYFTPDGGWVGGAGGTSFVAPQLNGIAALMDQYVGSPIGFLNPTLYSLAKSGAYGPNAPLNDVSSGDNWFYNAQPGYDLGSGVGTPNVAQLANVFRSQVSGSSESDH